LLSRDNTIIYQIFPDRFNKVNNNQKKYKNWGEKPTRRDHFGGNLKGIKDRIPYLKKLGINCIYLTPIFLAPSPHKYDTQDYMRIDPNFGNMDDFEDLLKSLHDDGMKLLLDGVFNHTGDRFWAFKDCEINGETSQYWNWYHIHGFPIKRFPNPNYEDAGIYYLPKLNHDNNDLLDYLKQVVKFWTSKGIDGWRFDMPWCIKPDFCSELINEAKGINPNIFVIGEYWGLPYELLEKYPFDGAMDYILRDNVINLLKGTIDLHTFVQNLSYKEHLRFNRCWNMLGSHDTSRIRGILKSDKKVKIAFTLQFTFPGIPIIYYGDEIGMFGGRDPDCRRTFNWDKESWNMSIYDHVKDLCNFREGLTNIENFKFLEFKDKKLTYLLEDTKSSFMIEIDLKNYISEIHEL